ncbi:MAG: bifunctional metallophosphatase/5'-nucleotidase, partial [Croceibacterium sp.]
ALGACATVPADRAPAPDISPVTVGLIAINDFHGNLEPPKQSVEATAPDGSKLRVPVGGAAYLASAIDTLRGKYANNLVVSAGDLIGASPITSSLFLDEPTIGVMNRIGLDFNAVGNHEFDRGWAELLRMQNGGCEKLTMRQPCRVEPQFRGAKFRFLAANVATEKGDTLFPASAMRSFGSGAGAVQVGLIGLTLQDTPNLASPSGVAGLTFGDEADAINREVAKLKAQGADAIAVLIHQGLYTTVPYNDHGCGGVSGGLLPILARLDPRVDLVISGHTHWAYVCDYGQIDTTRPFLVTSGGVYGELVTDISLQIDPASGKVLSRRADNVLVQSEAYTATRGDVPTSDLFPRFAARPDIAAYVGTYAAAVKAEANRVIGYLDGGAAFKPVKATNETALGNLIADMQLAATAAPDRGAAQIELMNNSGIRADLAPAADGAVTFGAIYAVQPFANTLVTRSYTGMQLKALLEQQFDTAGFDQAFSPSAGFTYAFDLSRPLGARVFDVMLNGQPITDSATYRVTMNSFLANGGDNFTVFRDGTNTVNGAVDLDAAEEWFRSSPRQMLPATGRIRNLTPAQ